MVCIGKSLYTAGGYNSVSSRIRCLLSAEKYSVETDQWTKITGMESDIAHFNMLGNTIALDQITIQITIFFLFS